MILAIDPGPTESAYVEYDGERIGAIGKWSNDLLLLSLRRDVDNIDVLVIEQIASYGMAVGAEVFETCYWSGRFAEAFLNSRGRRAKVERIPRLHVKLQLCRDSRAKDANVRQSLIDRFGGKEKAIGCKKAPGPLYGVKSDMWSALAVGVTYWETRHVREVA